MKRPRLNILRVFEAAGRRLSFSLAAKEMHISPAAVSQQIRQLEAYLDAQLFVRSHRQLSLTPIGQAYLLGVHEALDRLDNITDQLFPTRTHHTVTLHCTSSVATLWLAPALGFFQQLNPDIDLRVRTLEQNFDGSGSNGTELEIVLLNDEDVTVDAHNLLTAFVIPVGSPQHLPKASGLKKPDDVLGFQLIHVLGYEDDWHRWFRRHQLADIAVPTGMTVDSSLIGLEACQRGDGIMLGQRPFIDPYLQSGELVEVFQTPFTLQSSYYLRQRSKNANRRAIKAVEKWLDDLVSRSR